MYACKWNESTLVTNVYIFSIVCDGPQATYWIISNYKHTMTRNEQIGKIATPVGRIYFTTHKAELVSREMHLQYGK